MQTFWNFSINLWPCHVNNQHMLLGMQEHKHAWGSKSLQDTSSWHTSINWWNITQKCSVTATLDKASVQEQYKIMYHAMKLAQACSIYFHEYQQPPAQLYLSVKLPISSLCKTDIHKGTCFHEFVKEFVTFHHYPCDIYDQIKISLTTFL